MEEIAIAIPLKVWKDPQGDVILHYSCESCVIYFGCWITNIEPANYLCKLTFHRAWAVRGYLREEDYNVKEHDYRSYVYRVENSEWLHHEENRRSIASPDRKQWDTNTYNHYVVPGHDNHYDIIAADFTETTIPFESAGDLLRVIDGA